MIDRLPFAREFMKPAGMLGMTPLHCLFEEVTPNVTEKIKTAKLLISRGLVNPNQLDHIGDTALHYAARKINFVQPRLMENAYKMVEALLRMGCRAESWNVNGNSPISMALGRHSGDASQRLLEMLLAFGANIQKEKYLYPVEPFTITCFDFQDRRHSGAINRGLFSAIEDLRQSNALFSLKRLCRNAIRRRLMANADDAIRSSTCIPDEMKKYLLVENEPNVLDWSNDWNENNYQYLKNRLGYENQM